jgi:hypothetical protein
VLRRIGCLLSRAIDGHAFGQVAVSIGIAALPFNGNSWQAALKVADEALYAAKHGGKNQEAPVQPSGYRGSRSTLEPFPDEHSGLLQFPWFLVFSYMACSAW